MKKSLAAAAALALACGATLASFPAFAADAPPAAAAPAGPQRAEGDIVVRANAALVDRGFKVASFEAPKVEFETAGRLWVLTYAGKPPETARLVVMVDDRTFRAKVRQDR